MDIMKECATRIKNTPDSFHSIQDTTSYRDRIAVLNEVMVGLNISKCELSEFGEEDLLRLFYCLQQAGIVMGLCEYFRIFLSNRNLKYHCICEATRDRLRTFCRGDKCKCDYSIFDKNSLPLENNLPIKKKKKWKQV